MAPTLWDGAVADPLKCLLPICYHVNFGSGLSKCILTNIREPRKYGSAGSRWVVALLPLKISILNICVTASNLVVL